MQTVWCRPTVNFFNIYLTPLRHVLITLPFILTHLTLSYPLPWPPLPIFLTRPPSPIPPMPTQKKIRPRRPVWLPVGAARSYRAPEKLMSAKICAPADAGACYKMHRSGWGCDPHLCQRPLLTVLSVGALFLWQLGHGGGRVRRWRAPQTTGKLALQRPTPQHAAAPLSHTRTHPQHLP